MRSADTANVTYGGLYLGDLGSRSATDVLSVKTTSVRHMDLDGIGGGRN